METTSYDEHGELFKSKTLAFVQPLITQLCPLHIPTDIPTDSHLYLPPSSAYPKHVLEFAILFGIVSRVCRNCSEETFLNRWLEEFKGYLVNQGYPAELVSCKFFRAANIPRNDYKKEKVCFLEMHETVAVGEKGECFGPDDTMHVSTFFTLCSSVSQLLIFGFCC